MNSVPLLKEWESQILLSDSNNETIVKLIEICKNRPLPKKVKIFYFYLLYIYIIVFRK